jgi:hypothetical protein
MQGLHFLIAYERIAGKGNKLHGRVYDCLNERMNSNRIRKKVVGVRLNVFLCKRVQNSSMALGAIDVRFKRRSICDFPLAASWANARAWRQADEPDEAHRAKMAKLGPII